MLALRLTLASVAAVLRAAIAAGGSSPSTPGQLDFSQPDNSALIALLEDI